MMSIGCVLFIDISMLLFVAPYLPVCISQRVCVPLALTAPVMPVYVIVANILMKDLRSEEEDLLRVSSHVSNTVISWMVVGLALHLEKQISLKERGCIAFRSIRQEVELVHPFARVLEDNK